MRIDRIHNRDELALLLVNASACPPLGASVNAGVKGSRLKPQNRKRKQDENGRVTEPKAAGVRMLTRGARANDGFFSSEGKGRFSEGSLAGE